MIDKKFRNNGYGTLLLNLTTPLETDFEMIELRTASDNYPAIRFYQKNGFTIVGGDLYFSKGFKI